MTARSRVQVTIVATSAETLDGLQGYLTRAGLNARASRSMVGADADPCSVVVLFPDDFATDDVLQELLRIRQERPNVLVVVVTNKPQRYAASVELDGKGQVPLVLPRPAWGFSILDAIRDLLDADG